MAKRKMSDEMYEEIMQDIESGTSLSQAARKRDITAQAVKCRAGTCSAASLRYARARQAQARSHFEEMQELEQRVIDGSLDAQRYRVVADSRKWRLAKLHPSEYGDKQQVELSGSVDMAGVIASARRRAQLVENVEDAEVLPSADDPAI